MAVHLLRLLILYIVVSISIRLMGRRQVGELQPSELVITILLSEIAAIPIENNDIPILDSVVAVFVLTALEILLSALCMKSNRFRSWSQGNPILVIRNGQLDQRALKKMRITLDDLLEAMREKDIFDLSEVEFAIVEANGKLSVQLKSEHQPVTTKDLQIQKQSYGMACPLVYDGRIQFENFSLCKMNRQKFDSIIRRSGIPVSDILLLTADQKGVISCIRKEKSS